MHIDIEYKMFVWPRIASIDIKKNCHDKAEQNVRQTIFFFLQIKRSLAPDLTETVHLLHTQRSWVHEFFILFTTFSPQLGNNDTLKLCSGNFPYITCVTMYGKLSELHLIVSLFLNCGEKVLKSSKTLVPQFLYFLGPSSRDLRTTIQWTVVLKIFHTWWHICFVCNILPQLRGEGPNKDKNFRLPGSQSVTNRGREQRYIIFPLLGLTGS